MGMLVYPSHCYLDRILCHTTAFAFDAGLFHTLLGCMLIAPYLLINANAQENDPFQLPELGDSASALASKDEVFKLGQSWLRQFRARVPESTDAQMYDYVEKLLDKLAESSALEDKRLELIIVKNRR